MRKMLTLSNLAVKFICHVALKFSSFRVQIENSTITKIENDCRENIKDEKRGKLTEGIKAVFQPSDNEIC